jgi:suppressor of ftsI
MIPNGKIDIQGGLARLLFEPIRLLSFVVVAVLLPAAPAWSGQFDTLLGMPHNLAASAAVDPLSVPVEYQSHDGELDVTLEARRTVVRLGKTEINGATYDGVYGGPVLRVRPGDMLHLRLVNKLPQATNIHFHGMNVSPRSHGDNSMHMVKPGESWDYEIPVAKDHPPGVYWFHTHAHEAAERQLMGGLSGTLVVEGFQDLMPATRPLKERLMALKEFSPDRHGDLHHVPKPYNLVIKTINGQLMPRIDMQPGESQLWRLSDQTANTYFRLTLEGHKFIVVGRDGQALAQPETVSELMFGPSQRVDVVVTASAAGAYKLVAERTATGPVGDMFPAQNMALVASAAVPGEPPPAPLGALVPSGAQSMPISDTRIDAQRLVTFSEDPVTALFFINHQTFDPKRVDIKVPLGSIEEWTIRNASEELHVFHLHQVHFQVLSVNGRPLPFSGLVDTVNVPIHGEVKIRAAFTDPTIIGRFMYHCHILEHEDKGMMAQMEVYDPKTGPLPDNDMAMEMNGSSATVGTGRNTGSGNTDAAHAGHR